MPDDYAFLSLLILSAYASAAILMAIKYIKAVNAKNQEMVKLKKEGLALKASLDASRHLYLVAREQFCAQTNAESRLSEEIIRNKYYAEFDSRTMNAVFSGRWGTTPGGADSPVIVLVIYGIVPQQPDVFFIRYHSTDGRPLSTCFHRREGLIYKDGTSSSDWLNLLIACDAQALVASATEQKGS